MAQILTYPYGTKYRTSDWGSQVKDGVGGSIPCNNEVYVGNYIQNTGGINWWGESGFGQDNASASASDNRHWRQPNDGSSQKGLAFWMQTSTNGKTTARWFDIGAEGGRTDGSYVNNNARCSWLREVTGVWFLFNGHDTTTTRDCYARVEHVAIRYRDPNGYIRIKKVTEKLGELNYMEGIRGTSKYMFGYRLNSSDASTICNNNWHFLGLRIQFQIKRGGTGVTTDYVQAGVTGLRLSLGNFDNAWNTSNKRALVLRGNQTWNEYNSATKWPLEDR